jgi:hypothetical protein
MPSSAFSTSAAATLVLLVSAHNSLMVCAQDQPNGWPSVVAGAGLELIGGIFGECGMLNDRCKCRNMYAIVNSFDPPKGHNGPRIVFKSEDYDHGTRCQLGNNPVLSGQSGGISAGNSQNSMATGVEGNVYWELWSDDGLTSLDCNLHVYMDNPYVGSNTMRANLHGPGCDRNNLAVHMGQLLSQETDGGAEVFVWYTSKPSETEKNGENADQMA